MSDTAFNSIVSVRDEMDVMVDVMRVCRMALDAVKDQDVDAVSNTLFFQVEQKMKLLNEALGKL